MWVSICQWVCRVGVHESVGVSVCVCTWVSGCVCVHEHVRVLVQGGSHKLPKAAVGDDCSKDGREVAEHNEGVVQGGGSVLLVGEEADQVQRQHSWDGREEEWQTRCIHSNLTVETSQCQPRPHPAYLSVHSMRSVHRTHSQR